MTLMLDNRPSRCSTESNELVPLARRAADAAISHDLLTYFRQMGTARSREDRLPCYAHRGGATGCAVGFANPVIIEQIAQWGRALADAEFAWAIGRLSTAAEFGEESGLMIKALESVVARLERPATRSRYKLAQPQTAGSVFAWPGPCKGGPCPVAGTRVTFRRRGCGTAAAPGPCVTACRSA
jgi:hypothetical protein